MCLNCTDKHTVDAIWTQLRLQSELIRSISFRAFFIHLPHRLNKWLDAIHALLKLKSLKQLENGCAYTPVRFVWLFFLLLFEKRIIIVFDLKLFFGFKGRRYRVDCIKIAFAFDEIEWSSERCSTIGSSFCRCNFGCYKRPARKKKWWTYISRIFALDFSLFALSWKVWFLYI